MFDFAKWFRKTFRTDPRFGGRTPTARRQRTHLVLEALEDRVVPTVAFTPQLGTTFETSSPSANSSSLQSAPVVLIFTGNYWQQSSQGQQDELTIINSVGSIVGGPYLSKLTQYGSDGHASLAQSYQDSTTPTLDGGNTPSGRTLVNFVNNIISQNPDVVPPTDPNNPQQAPLYVLVNDPQDSSPNPGTYGYNQWTGSTHAAYVGATANSPGGPVNLDAFTQVFSHELAEAVAPNITVNDPGNLGQGNQIADNEPEQGAGYAYRLNGVLVQAYWSQSDHAFVVPDGNTQTFTLNPIWSNGSFTGQHNLSVTGDQRGANYNDLITIDQVGAGPQAGGVLVNLNGETASFDPGTISTINVNTGGGTNTVNVAAVPAGLTLNVTSFSLGQNQSSDTVTVGSNGSLANIAGTVNVSNGSGQTTLIVSDSSDTAGQSVDITNNAVTFSNMPGQVNYTGASYSNGTLLGVTALDVDGGSGSNTFTVNSTAANTPVTINTGPLSGEAGSTVYIEGSSSAVSVQSTGNDMVFVGNSGSLAGIGGPVNVSNTSGRGEDALVIDDSSDSSGRSIDMTSHAVTFAATGSEPAVTINYTPAQLNNNGQLGGVNALTLWDAQAANQIEVDSVGSNTTTIIEGDTQDVLTGAATGQVQFNPYRT